jgi:hypothetical protein
LSLRSRSKFCALGRWIDEGPGASPEAPGLLVLCFLRARGLGLVCPFRPIADIRTVSHNLGMPALDLSPWLAILAPLTAASGYVAHRGFVRNEFRRKFRNGWFRYKPWSLNWVSSTLLNLLFVVVFSYLTYQSVFHGSTFSRGDQTTSVEANLRCDDAASEITADACTTR